ncbi:MAG: ATP-binding protein [Candidatus Omnitrophica bacterium]|nr:ATP-binding protein [Candidatus Omnitrophota bacterium]
MRRTILNKLISWKSSEQRKPLILKGVRQVGKTWLLREFGKKYYENTAYFNFDEQSGLKQYFETDKDARRIIKNLALINGAPILPGKTLIIFDEIQECNAALNALKYFCENAPEYHVVCAGSLLGIRVSKPESFPVGKVEFLTVHPMTFTEFLWASKEEKLIQYIDNIDSLDQIPDIFFNQLHEKLKMYFITGGMPESVRAWAEEQDIARVQKVLQDILNAYELDFSKHAEIKDIAKLGLIWSSIPSQLSKENKKFIYRAVKEGVRAREYEGALTWLCNAGLAYKIYRNTKPGLPVSAYDDPGAFKLYLVDAGLLRRLALLDPVSFNEGNRLFSEFKGALSENYILQSLAAQYEGLPRYWSSGATAEVDFMIQRGNDILPIEVKSDENVRGKSFALYNQKYAPLIRVRFSLKNLKKDGNLVNIPMFLADHLDKLIGLALRPKDIESYQENA